MDPLTHVASGLVLSQLIPAPSRWWAALAGVILSLAPDSDIFWGLGDNFSHIRYHRAFTHSLVAVPLWSLLAAVAGRLLGGAKWFQPLFLLGLAVLTAHLLLDLATAYGTQIFSPFSPRKYTLDWIFIIDPYFTGVLLAGALAALLAPGWGRRAGAACLAGAAVYLLICGHYHHQALNLARQVFAAEARDGATVAALPQPFSCRRWQLIAARPREIKQALVLLPFRPGGKGAIGEVRPIGAEAACPRAPLGEYRPPDNLLVQDWRAAPLTLPPYSAEARHLLDIYLDFARFPLLTWAGPQGDGLLLEWVDLRFTVPGRAFPFVLQLHLDREGGLLHGGIGRCQEDRDASRGKS